jgi:uncharacterized membrane protein
MQVIFLKVRKVLRITLTVIGLFYPFFIYFGLTVYSARTIACLIGAFIVGNFLVQNRHAYQIRFVLPLVAIIVLYVISALLNSSTFILYLPYLISSSFLVSFSYSLLCPPSTIEVFARLAVPDLSSEEIAYCRRITLVWVGFWGVNGVAAFYTACCTSLGVWSLYNGLLAYLGIGALFVVELSYRSWRFRRYVGLPTDFIFKRLFPPEA